MKGWQGSLETGRDRHASSAAESLGTDLNAGRGLPALVFVMFDQFDYFSHQLGVEAAEPNNLIFIQGFIDIKLQDAIKFVIRRQGIAVFLLGP